MTLQILVYTDHTFLVVFLEFQSIQYVCWLPTIRVQLFQNGPTNVLLISIKMLSPGELLTPVQGLSSCHLL